MKVDGEGLVIQIDQLMKHRIIKRRKYDLSTIRQQIICKLRDIEHILIFNSENPSLIINNQELILIENDDQQRTTTFGHLLSFIYELKYYTNQLKSRSMLSKEFNDDINLLTYTQLTVKQKLRIIQQISHSYSFLVHA